MGVTRPCLRFAGTSEQPEIASQQHPLKHRIRDKYKFYSQDLINNLFAHPYTKIQFVMDDLKVTRLTATRYLDELADGGFLAKKKIGRSSFYINHALMDILAGDDMAAAASA